MWPEWCARAAVRLHLLRSVLPDPGGPGLARGHRRAALRDRGHLLPARRGLGGADHPAPHPVRPPGRPAVRGVGPPIRVGRTGSAHPWSPRRAPGPPVHSRPWACSGSSSASSAWSRAPSARPSRAASSRWRSAARSPASSTRTGRWACTACPSSPTTSASTSPTSDFDRFESFADALARELAELVREHAREEGYQFVGSVTVHLVPDEELQGGRVRRRHRDRRGRPRRLAAPLRRTSHRASASRRSPSDASPTTTSWSPTRRRPASTPRSARPATASSSSISSRPTAPRSTGPTSASTSSSTATGSRSVRPSSASRRRRPTAVPESALTLLKFLFLALIYLFLFFVVRVVLRELRTPALAPAGGAPAQPATPQGRATEGVRHAARRRARVAQGRARARSTTRSPWAEAAAARWCSPTTTTRPRCTRGCSAAATTSSSTTSSRATAPS